MLLDSNILIYAARPEHVQLREFLTRNTPAVSVVTYIEVLGYHRLQPDDRLALEGFFAATEILPLSDGVIRQAVKLRQEHKMSLGDSIIAATALVHHRTLLTRNTDDFRWIADLQLLNPLADMP